MKKKQIVKYIKQAIDPTIFGIWVYVIFVLPPLFLSQITYIITPNYFSLNQADQFTSALAFLAKVFIFLPGVGVFLRILTKKTSFIFFWRLQKDWIITYLTTALLFAYFSWQFLSILHNWQYLGLFLLFIFYVFYIPQVIQFLNLFGLKTFNTLFKSIYTGKTIKKILILIITILSIHVTINIIYKTSLLYEHHQSFLAQSPHINKSEPEIVYYASQVVLIGRGFGWKQGNIDTKFKYQDGTIDITLWTDTKVVFNLPLHWKEGDITIWVEKPIEWDGKKILVKSNVITLRLISRDNGWDKDDDAYFEQLKSLSDEVLQLNGYAPKK